MKATTTSIAAIVIACASTATLAGSADQHLSQIVGAVQQNVARASGDAWVNPLLPQASGSYVASADERMTQIVAQFTQQHLDGAAFVNTVMTQHGYDAGHPFEAVLAGAGTTQGATPDVAVAADVLVQRIVVGYTRGILDRGGWVNAYVDSPNYAVGNMLASVEVGEGVTTTSVRA